MVRRARRWRAGAGRAGTRPGESPTPGPIPPNLLLNRFFSYDTDMHQDNYRVSRGIAELSQLALTTPRSMIRDVFDKAARTPGVISLALGEPSTTAPDHVVQAGIDAIRAGHTHYTDVLGIPEYRRAVADYTRRIKGLSYDPGTEVHATPGATLALYLALRVLLDPGDEVAVFTPAFGTYEAQVILSGATPVRVPLRPEVGMRMEAAELERALTSRTKAVIVNTPGNPTGAVTDVPELQRIAAVCRAHDLWAISDEVYHPFVFDTGEADRIVPAPSIAACPGMRERTIVVDSLSKVFAMTGWRIGHMLAPHRVIVESSKLAEQMNSSLNAPAQYAGAAALSGPLDHVLRMRTQYEGTRDVVLDILRDHPQLRVSSSMGAFFALVDVRGTGLTSGQFADRLLEQEHVAVVPGEAFGPGGDGFVRLSFAGDRTDVARGVERMAHFADTLGHGALVA